MDQLDSFAEEFEALVEKHQLEAILVVVPLDKDLMVMSNGISPSGMHRIGTVLSEHTPEQSVTIN